MMGLNFWLSMLALGLAVAGGLLLWWRQSKGGEIALMVAVPTSKAAEAAKLAPGTLAEVKGTLRCAQPISSEFGHQSCVYYKSEIEREEVYYERDSEGRDQRKTRSTTVHSHSQFAPCMVEDDSGRIAVDLDGADIEAVQTISAYGLPDGVNMNTGSGIGGVLSSLASVLSNTNTSYRHTEHVLALDIPVYLMGEVRAGGTIGKPGKGSHNKTFVISYKSEEQRAKDIGSTMMWLMIWAIVLFVAAAGVLYWAYSKGPA